MANILMCIYILFSELSTLSLIQITMAQQPNVQNKANNAFQTLATEIPNLLQQLQQIMVNRMYCILF